MKRKQGGQYLGPNTDGSVPRETVPEPGELPPTPPPPEPRLVIRGWVVDQTGHPLGKRTLYKTTSNDAYPRMADGEVDALGFFELRLWRKVTVRKALFRVKGDDGDWYRWAPGATQWEILKAGRDLSGVEFRLAESPLPRSSRGCRFPGGEVPPDGWDREPTDPPPPDSGD
ncbi:MAG: hypothetical protein ACYTDX_01155 [Planctomycetota bacterium]